MFEIALLTTALIFGGTVLYAFGFTTFVFTAITPERKAWKKGRITG